MKVIGHRGAAGYVPENTLEGFQTAFEMGADVVELDIVPTRDGVLLVRHEGELELTTNIAEIVEFQDRCSFDANGTPHWLAENFTRNELRVLHARERYPEVRLASAVQDDLYLVSSLSEVFNDSRFAGKSFIIELKHAQRYKALGLDMVKILEECMLESAFPHGIDVSFESFDWETCVRLMKLFPELNIVYALDAAHWERMYSDDVSQQDAAAEDFVAKTLSAGFASVACSFDLLVDVSAGGSGLETQLYRRLEASPLLTYGFTASDDLGAMGAPAGKDYWEWLSGWGLAGVFTDQPDKLHAARLV